MISFNCFKNSKFIKIIMILEINNPENYFGLIVFNNKIQTIIFDFIESKYYIHKELFDLNSSFIGKIMIKLEGQLKMKKLFFCSSTYF